MNRTLLTVITLLALALSACVAASPPSDSGQAVNPTTEPSASPAATGPAATSVLPSATAEEAPAPTSTPAATQAPDATPTTPVRGTPIPAEPTQGATPVRGTPVTLPTEEPVNDDLGLAVPLTTELLKNSIYLVPAAYGNPVQMVDGFYQDHSDPNAPLTVRLLEEAIGYGDVDGDGLEDAVVPLATNTGGSGVFIDIAVMSGKSGTAMQISSASLGDRVVVNGITVQYPLVTLDLVTHGPNDPSCCPTQEVIVNYTYHDGVLTPVE